MFGKLLKTDPFLPISSHPPPSFRKIENSHACCCKPHHMLEGCASSCVCFLHFPSTCQFPELSLFEQGGCKSLQYLSFLRGLNGQWPFKHCTWLVPSHAELMSSVRMTAKTWRHPCTWFCLFCLRAPSTVTVKLWNVRRGCSQWDRASLCFGKPCFGSWQCYEGHGSQQEGQFCRFCSALNCE